MNLAFHHPRGTITHSLASLTAWLSVLLAASVQRCLPAGALHRCPDEAERISLRPALRVSLMVPDGSLCIWPRQVLLRTRFKVAGDPAASEMGFEYVNTCCSLASLQAEGFKVLFIFRLSQHIKFKISFLQVCERCCIQGRHICVYADC